MTNRVSPNEITDTDFYSQDINANQTLTGVVKVATDDGGGVTRINQNLDGTEDIIQQPIIIERIEPISIDHL